MVFLDRYLSCTSYRSACGHAPTDLAHLNPVR
jgi:hypothetical protein